MPVVTCSHCNARLRVGDQNMGRRCRCPKCGEIFLLQAVSDQPDEPALVPAPVSPSPPVMTRQDRFFMLGFRNTAQE